MADGQEVHEQISDIEATLTGPVNAVAPPSPCVASSSGRHGRPPHFLDHMAHIRWQESWSHRLPGARTRVRRLAMSLRRASRTAQSPRETMG
jgi:hypothetical protein